MERQVEITLEMSESEKRQSRLYVPYPGADEKYNDGSDWRIYNPDKYRDPEWSPDKE